MGWVAKEAGTDWVQSEEEPSENPLSRRPGAGPRAQGRKSGQVIDPSPVFFGHLCDFLSPIPASESLGADTLFYSSLQSLQRAGHGLYMGAEFIFKISPLSGP